MSIERGLEGVGGFLDDRFHGARGLRSFLKKIFPDHWTFLLGEIALYSFIILLLTGTILTFWFQPSMTSVVYHGSYTPLHGVRMSEAYASTLNISFDVRGGLLMRQMHHWSAMLFIAAMFVHMMRTFVTGAFRKPRELNWVIGSLLLLLGILEGFAGYSLPDDIKPWKGRENWGVEGILCFSKICTHVGCPISLNERTTHHLLCPCHQSTFDLADSARVIFGPAGRPLPQLPLAVDDEGYLVAQSDFHEPVGPSFWERDSK
jgi:hypothetical protein